MIILLMSEYVVGLIFQSNQKLVDASCFASNQELWDKQERAVEVLSAVVLLHREAETTDSTVCENWYMRVYTGRYNCSAGKQQATLTLLQHHRTLCESSHTVDIPKNSLGSLEYRNQYKSMKPHHLVYTVFLLVNSYYDLWLKLHTLE